MFKCEHARLSSLFPLNLLPGHLEHKTVPCSCRLNVYGNLTRCLKLQLANLSYLANMLDSQAQSVADKAHAVVKSTNFQHLDSKFVTHLDQFRCVFFYCTAVLPKDLDFQAQGLPQDVDALFVFRVVLQTIRSVM